MKYNKNIIYNYLKYYADKQPHKYHSQHLLFVARYPKEVKKLKLNIIKLTKYCVSNGWLTGVGIDFYRTYFPFRTFILTDKGDEYFRLLSIIRGGDHSFYKGFDREREKEWKTY